MSVDKHAIGRFGEDRAPSDLYCLLARKLPSHTYMEGDRLILDTAKIAEEMGVKNKQTVWHWTKNNAFPANRLHRFLSLSGSKLKDEDLIPFISRV